MDMHPFLIFYSKIMNAECEEDIKDLDNEVKSAVLSKILTSDRDIATLNLALQMKSNFFLLKEIQKEQSSTTIIVMGDIDDFDPEQIQLDEMQQEEVEELEENVVLMKNFNKKD